MKNLNKNQKAAIVRYLLSITKADGQIQKKKIDSVQNISNSLEFNMEDPDSIILFEQGIGPMIENLKGLSFDQRMWLVNTVKELLLFNGSVNANEFKYALGVLKHVGLADELTQIMPKVQPKNGCYIATVVYGDESAHEVVVLKNFRDEILSKNAFGRCFIKMYYFLSPTIASMLEGKHKLNKLIKIKILDRIVQKIK